MGECEHDCECGGLDICGLWFVCVEGGLVYMSLYGCLMLSMCLSGGRLGYYWCSCVSGAKGMDAYLFIYVFILKCVWV